MKYIIIITVFITIISCNGKHENNYILYPDSTNYQYILLKNDLLKVVRFFPGTKDTSVILFYRENRIKDSTAYYFDKDGILFDEIKYEDNMRIRKCKTFYKSGHIKKQFTIIDGHTQGNVYYFYKNGILRAIHEIILFNGEKYLNNERVYNNLGKFIADSTFFFELMPENDTISISDSVLVSIYFEKNRTYAYRALTGALDSNFQVIDIKNMYQIPREYFFYRPTKIGKNIIRVVFETNVTPDSIPTIRRIFKEKSIYVTK